MYKVIISQSFEIHFYFITLVATGKGKEGADHSQVNSSKEVERILISVSCYLGSSYKFSGNADD